MQDGVKAGEGAAIWLREHFKDDPEPEINIAWTAAAEPDRSYERLLEILFSPYRGDKAA
ncbi:hypothetical protein ACFYYH_15095 [Streptomyces sp. NPDC002018]|uniref:hypothetical protein n=1 Tax=Streptomyces sp. NPDC002018 TaxID=3364629 RepID=UPI0036A72BA6